MRAVRKLNEFALRAWARFAAAKALLKGERGDVMQALLVLGVATVLLGATIYLAYPTIEKWWNAKIMPQFPTQ